MNLHISATELLLILKNIGTRDIVISRDIPEDMQAAACRNLEDMKFHIFSDSRICGFMALGLTKGSNNPVAVIIREQELPQLFPAVMEASVTGFSFIIISIHDSEEAYISIASGTLDPVFKNYTDYLELDFANNIAGPAGRTHRIVNAVTLAGLNRRPLHIAFFENRDRLSAPAENTTDHKEDEDTAEELYSRELIKLTETVSSCFHLPHPNTGGIPLPDIKGSETFADDFIPDEFIPHETRKSINLLNRISSTGSVLVIAGCLTPSEAEEILPFLEKTRFPVIADVQSNLRGKKGINLIRNPDDYLKAAENAAVSQEPRLPGYVLIVGGRFISTAVLRFLKNLNGRTAIFINNSARNLNAVNVTGTVITMPYRFLIKAVPDCLPENLPERIYASRYASVPEDSANNDLPEIITGDIELFRVLNIILPPENRLFIGNSTAARHAEKLLYTAGSIYTSRGVSGIDGLIATACGISAGGTDSGTVAVIGDTSALYDLSSIALLKHYPVKLIIINNNGGMIFRKFPIESQDVLKSSFINPHGLDFKNISQSFNVPYRLISNVRDLQQSLAEKNTSMVLELKTA